MKRSQAALEFLTTYGWAFLVILIMIGTLAYFGVLSPSKILPNRCTFGTEFNCLDYQLTTTAFKFRIKNNMGEPIDISSMAFTSEAITAFSCTAPPANPTSWKTGEVKELSWTGCTGGGLVQGEKGKVGITIQYNTVASGATYKKEVKGEVFTTVV